METIRQLQKKYCSRAMAAAIAIGLVLILAGLRPVGKGLVLGTLFSAINFILMAEFAPHRIGRTSRKGFILSLTSIGLRYILLGIPLAIAIKFDAFDLIGAIIGIFMIQLVILCDHLLRMWPLQRQNRIRNTD